MMQTTRRKRRIGRRRMLCDVRWCRPALALLICAAALAELCLGVASVVEVARSHSSHPGAAAAIGVAHLLVTVVLAGLAFLIVKTPGWVANFSAVPRPWFATVAFILYCSYLLSRLWNKIVPHLPADHSLLDLAASTGSRLAISAAAGVLLAGLGLVCARRIEARKGGRGEARSTSASSR